MTTEIRLLHDTHPKNKGSDGFFFCWGEGRIQQHALEQHAADQLHQVSG